MARVAVIIRHLIPFPPRVMGIITEDFTPPADGDIDKHLNSLAEARIKELKEEFGMMFNEVKELVPEITPDDLHYYISLADM